MPKTSKMGSREAIGDSSQLFRRAWEARAERQSLRKTVTDKEGKQFRVTITISPVTP